MKKLIPILCVLTISSGSLCGAEQNGAGTFVSFKDGTLTLKDASGLVHFKQVGASYKTFQNNENGAGSKQVDTIAALSQMLPGTVIEVNVQDREISFGLDHRVVGTFESYTAGKLTLLAADPPPGYVKRPTGTIALTIDPSIPVLESVQGSDYRPAGQAGVILKTLKPGTMVTARSEYDVNVIEVIQIGDPKRRMERYVGQSRGTVRGTFVSLKDGVLRIRGKGLTSLAANEYDRVIAVRIADYVPIVESIDGGAYMPAGPDALKSVREGTILTIRKVEEIVLEVQIGMAKK